jgi:hypothetical protein
MRLRGGPDAVAGPGRDAVFMRTTYGVVWREGLGPLARGKLELLPSSVRLEGMSGSEPASLEIAYLELSGIRIGRSVDERIDGRVALVLVRHAGDEVTVASVAQAGVLREIADRLSGLRHPLVSA